MKNRKLKLILFSLLAAVCFNVSAFAAVLDPSIPVFNPNHLTLSSDGTATFVIPVFGGGNYKRFDIQLLKRVTTVDASSNVSYTYKTQGSIRHVEPTDSSFEFTFSSTGYYQFQIRAVNLEGNYGEWRAIYDNSTWSSQKEKYPGIAVTEDDISIGGGGGNSGIGSGSDYYYGPGVVNQYYPYYQNGYGIIGPNGQYIYNGQQYAYNNQSIYPNTGIPAYQQVPSPYGTANPNYNQGYNQNYNQYNGQYNQNGQINPNYYNGNTTNNTNNNYYPNNNANYGSPQISQGLEIGWHIDNNGRFYYQGNGVVLKGTWYFIDGSYYRFSDNGYMLANQWFKDNSTGYWYYLGGDGKMLTGWQCLNGTWYYFKPENGNGYGTMYRNATLQITDAAWGTGFYAFDSNGATVMNAWYGGYYYGRDGKRTN